MLVETLMGDCLGLGNKGYVVAIITRVTSESHFPGPKQAKEA